MDHSFTHLLSQIITTTTVVRQTDTWRKTHKAIDAVTFFVVVVWFV